MAIFKFWPIKYGIIFLCLFVSCNQTHTKDKSKIGLFATTDSMHVGKDLEKISIDFIKKYAIANSVIEVSINKKEPNETFIYLTCRGLGYFAVKSLAPSFTYEISNNTFFVFTGTEDLLHTTFIESKYKNRQIEKCGDEIKACYVFTGSTILELDSCSFPDPFSSMPAPVSPPPLKK